MSPRWRFKAEMCFSTCSRFLQPDAHTCEPLSWAVRCVSGQGSLTMRKWCVVWITTPFSACFAGHCARGNWTTRYVIPRLLSNMYLFYRLMEMLSSLRKATGSYWLPAEGLWYDVHGDSRVPPRLWPAGLLPGAAVLHEQLLVCHAPQWRTCPWIHAQRIGPLHHWGRSW